MQTIPGVGEILALTWALEVGEVKRFPLIGQAASYSGLTSAQRGSARQRTTGADLQTAQ
jgi:transposase